ncbi:DUF5050 domain-containing protein [Caulobacter sp. NIBR1757]|uniref:DUF5050 domain-containing protein n=1 Tax=Caulobacter sp. NIBR1757 TaxID=3016000 RepID=UPI0022F10279|nr:DUF5050 domain-containing protein [Caulobacter sp. NIBR1757]WGM39461.1 hypothetical protein AMEJIAPC_02381 [Caulobacter sp. NIBR1757]
MSQIPKGLVINPGDANTLSPPCVTNDAIYFRGTDNALKKVSTVESGSPIRLNDESTVTTPFVSGDRVFFMGADNALKSVKTDGSDRQEYGLATMSTPWVNNDWIVFHGTDDRLLRYDRHGQGIFDYNVTTSSSPVVAGDNVYFQGTDNRLLTVPLTGGACTSIGGMKVDGAVSVDDGGTIVFKAYDPEAGQTIPGPGGAPIPKTSGPDQLLLAFKPGGPARRLSKTVVHVSPSAPLASAGWVYFRGAHNNGLFRCTVDGDDLQQVGETMQTWSTPGGYKGKIAWQGVSDNRLWYVDLS